MVSSIRRITGEGGSNECTFPGAQVGVKSQGSNHAFHVRLPGVCAGRACILHVFVFLDPVTEVILALFQRK